VSKKVLSSRLTSMKNSDRLDSLLDWLYARVNYERQSTATSDSFKLKNMRALAEQLQNPHLKYPVVHVAGTKGKGSVSAMLGQIFSASGRKTGVYTSPHIEAINQRITLDGLPIPDFHLAEILTRLRPIVDEMDAAAESVEALRPVTFFEIVTTAAMYYFANKEVDVAVFEVGLGGRLDSTNICVPAVSVIASISFDHTEQLGDTLAKIAYEKAGIIKPGVPIVSGIPRNETEPAEVIQSVAQDRQARLLQLGTDFHVATASSGQHAAFNFAAIEEDQPVCFDDIELAMRGTHQHHNAALAIAVCLELNRQGWSITENQIRTGLTRASLPGRTELVRRRPTVIMDIAHNLASMIALAETLLELPEFVDSRRKFLILAISKDKDALSMLEKILPHFDQVIFTTFSCNPRARDPHELLNFAEKIQQLTSQSAESGQLPKYQICESSDQAWALASSQATQDDFICIAGSVFLVADLRQRIR
jgi:dihydrofolate synthase / folylpolyglutamate synthase